MARKRNSLGWGGSGLHGGDAVKLRKALDTLEETSLRTIVAKVNELIDAHNAVPDATQVEKLPTE